MYQEGQDTDENLCTGDGTLARAGRDSTLEHYLYQRFFSSMMEEFESKKHNLSKVPRDGSVTRNSDSVGCEVKWKKNPKKDNQRTERPEF